MMQLSVRAQIVTATVVTTNPNDKFTHDGQDMPHYGVKWALQAEQYIRAHKHLPGIPSASEVTAKGLDVGEHQSLLLKKIEELTLYLIDLKKKNDQLKERLQKIETNKN